MTRTILAVMAGLLCALAGMRQASALHGEERRLRRWCEVLRHLTILLKEQAATLPEALCQAATGMQSPDTLLRAIAQTMQHEPTLPMQDAFAKHCSPCTERDALARMFLSLGRGTLQSRLLAVETAAAEVALMAEQAAQRAAKDAKLFQTLGFTGGACLTLLLL